MEGPSFLKHGESAWPDTLLSKTKQTAVEFERRATTKTYTTTNAESSFIDPTRFTSLRRLYRVTGCVKRFIANCKVRKKA